MIYCIYEHPSGNLLAIASSLEKIDEYLEDKTYLGRKVFRFAFGIYREQGTYKVLIATIDPCSLDVWKEWT